ncbi:hypothetical protein SAY87_013351 [Trapa incisa]|uniref:Cyclin N-terminal domain-containing protein n=1 Tax=Trapa incisa TaxID=236973 RepID=A0AAN7KG69_9MYRT|nr:hypothetical protein SAY87_013351 [Trapa incisa]
MSISYSDCLSDLLCEENSDGILSGDSLSPNRSLSELESLAVLDETIAELIEDEKDFVPGLDYLSRYRSQLLDPSAREESVAWILKVHTYYGFQPLTAYLAVNYMDRFLYSHSLPQTDEWPMQLLSVACLSLAAKMEEPLIPSLLDLQIEGTKFIFEPRTIRRMEHLVLTILNWRLRSVTPFSFICFFACKVDPSGSCIGYLISRSTSIILSDIQGTHQENYRFTSLCIIIYIYIRDGVYSAESRHMPIPIITETSILEFRPSCTAAAAVLCAANEIPSLIFLVNPEHAESWCDGLIKEEITCCYRLMQNLALLKNTKGRRPRKVLPPFRSTTRLRVSRFSDDSASSSSSISSPYKRKRKLNNSLWVDDGKGSSR